MPRLLLVLAVLFATKLVIVCAGFDRGFDIGDDGVFLFCLNDPANSPPLFEFYKLLTHLASPPQFDVVEIRVLRVVTELIATLALARAVFVWARPRFPGVAAAGFVPFLGVTLLGSLLSVGARGFGYNDATNFLLFLAVACTFRLLALPVSPATRAGRLGWAAAAGVAIGLQLFVKFPAALLLFGLTLISVLWLPRGDARSRLASAGALVASVAAAIALFVVTNGGFAPLLAKWRDAEELNRIAGYRVREILEVYYHNDYGSHVNGLRLWAVFALVFLIARRLWRQRPDVTDRALAAALVVGATVLAWGAWTFHAVNVHPSLVYLFCLLVLLAPLCWGLCLLRANRPELQRDDTFAPLLLLLALPVVAIVGTNVALTLKLPAHAAPIFLVLAITLTELGQSGLRRFASVALALLVVITSLVFFEHHVMRPYGLPSPLYRQTYETPLLPGLRVDAPTRKLLEDLHARLAEAGFEPGDPVIALDFMPGLVYAVGGRSPGFPFYAFDKAAQNCWAIARANLDEVPFLILGQDMLVEQHACIHAFEFPQDFREVAAIPNPYEGAIEYFFGGPAMPYLRVFAPIQRTSR